MCVYIQIKQLKCAQTFWFKFQKTVSEPSFTFLEQNFVVLCNILAHQEEFMSLFHYKRRSKHREAQIPFSLKCHSGAAWKIKPNTHTFTRTTTNVWHYSCTLPACVAFCRSPRRRDIDKPTNSNWTIMTPCDGIDSSASGAGG